MGRRLFLANPSTPTPAPRILNSQPCSGGRGPGASLQQIEPLEARLKPDRVLNPSLFKRDSNPTLTPKDNILIRTRTPTLILA